MIRTMAALLFAQEASISGSLAGGAGLLERVVLGCACNRLLEAPRLEAHGAAV